MLQDGEHLFKGKGVRKALGDNVQWSLANCSDDLAPDDAVIGESRVEQRWRACMPESRRTPPTGSSGGLRVVDLDPLTDARWEAFVASHPDGLIYHQTAWLRALESGYGLHPLGLACEDKAGELCGVLPLAHTRGLVTGRRLVSLPRTPVAGPLATEAEVGAVLTRAAMELASERPGTQLELRTPSAGLEGLVDGLARSAYADSYRLELPAQPDDLRFGNSRNHAHIQRGVNKAARSGVVVRPADTETDLRAWYALYLATMRDHASPPRPYYFFAAMWELLRPRAMMRLLLAERWEGGRYSLLAGSVLLTFGRTVHDAYNGRRKDALPLRPNDAIQWRAIHDACAAGFRYYDLGEVAGGHQGLADFKAKWGAEPTSLYVYRYPVPAGAPMVDVSGLGGRVRRVAEGAWRWLPLPATARLGEWIYKFA